MSKYFSLLTLVFIGFLFQPLPARAQTLPQLSFPVDCVLGQTCWTVNYTDTDPAADAHKDYMCNAKTTDDHKGTDFALRSRLEMERGVAVKAARAGRVLRVRDGESDDIKTEAEYQAIHKANKDCGNGILLDHGGAYQTFYCHLKKGSLKVKPGDQVTEGQTIAEIGQSGMAEFPHLHFAVIWENKTIDPFTGLTNAEGCGKFNDNLWKDDLPYEPFTVFDAGFRAAPPDFESIKRGEDNPATLPRNAPALVFWTGFYHAVKGDKLTLQIRAPDGSVFRENTYIIEENRKRPSYYYTGRNTDSTPLAPGVYKGAAIYERDGYGAKVVERTVTVQ